jgi:hypothetical protein
VRPLPQSATSGNINEHQPIESSSGARENAQQNTIVH